MATELIRLALKIEPDREPLRGSVEGEDGERREFEGWMEFAAAVEALVARGAAPHRGAQARRPSSR